jgi:hypothetical protein
LVAEEKTGEKMTVQTVKLAGKKFVIVAEKDYRNLKAQAAQARPVRRPKRLTARDRGDIAEARRRLADPTERPIPYEVVRHELGLA